MPLDASAQLEALRKKLPCNKFTDSQLSTLASIINTVFASTNLEDHPELSGIAKDEKVKLFLTSSASELQPNIEVILSNQLSQYAGDTTANNFRWILDMLETTAGSFFLTGYLKGWKELSTKEREEVILGWGKRSRCHFRNQSHSLNLNSIIYFNS
jgi:hypothetical protein